MEALAGVALIMIIRMVATTIIMRMEMNRVMSIGTVGRSTMSILMLVPMVCFVSY
jgi:hypothetical protein